MSEVWAAIAAAHELSVATARLPMYQLPLLKSESLKVSDDCESSTRRIFF
jgi:hypothetical protein